MDVKLPSGATATLRDPKSLRVGDKLAVQGMIAVDVSGGDLRLTLALSEEMKVAVIAHCVAAWSFTDAPSPESAQKLELPDYKKLVDATAKHRELLELGADKS